MRKLKFRVWDKKQKKMYYGDKQDEPNMIGFDGKIYTTGLTGPMCDYGCSADYINWCNPEDYELMQYTGLKDKNGKEIYEGDIVIAEDSYGNKWRGVVKYKDKHTAFFVEGKNVKAILGWHLTDNNDVFVEVLGNIWENPELLEEE